MMKERTNPKSVAPHKVKGTVLFTVVIVMMVLIVFLMAALALSATASRRAANTYSTAQTQATARAGVDAIISAMRNNKEIATAANDLSASGTQRVNVGEIKFSYMDNVKDEDDNVSRESIPVESIGTIKDSYIEYAGSTYQVEDGSLVAKDIIKVTAIAKQGTAETSYTAYLLKNPSSSGNTDGENHGFITTGSAISTNHTSIYGGAYVGFDQKWKNETLWKNSLPLKTLKYDATNSRNAYETDFMVNGTFTNDSGSDVYLVIKGPNSGMTVWGDMELSHKLIYATANAYETAFRDASKPKSYKEIPYIYVEGDIIMKGAGQEKKIGGAKINGDQATFDPNEKIPMNIFCGSIQETKEDGATEIMGNIYCYDSNKTTYLTQENNSKLYQWGTNHTIVKNVNGDNKSVLGGEFYTKGSLELKGTITFTNGLNVDRNLTVKDGTLTVQGDLQVGGTITLENNAEVSVTGKVVSPALDAGTKAKIKGSTTFETISAAALKEGYTPKVVTETVNVEKSRETYKNAFIHADGTVNKLDKDNNWGLDGVTNLVIENNRLIQHNDWGDQDYTPSGVTIQDGDKLVHNYVVVETEPQEVTVTKYYDSTNKEVSYEEAHDGGTFFPDEYEKKVILGERKPKDKTDDISNYKIITTVPEIMNSNYDPYSGTAFDVPDKLKEEVDKNVYDLKGKEKGYKLEINENCTIKNSANAYISVIAPPAGEERWVVLDGVKMDGGGYLIVDDSASTSGGTVNFLLVNDCSFSSDSDVGNYTMKNGNKWPGNGKTGYFTSAKIISEWFDTENEYQIYTDESYKKTGPLELTKPKINIFSTDKKNVTLTISNENLTTAHVKAPYMDWNQASKGGFPPKCKKLYYNGFDISKTEVTDVGCFGCMIVREFKAGNNWMMLFDGSSGGGQQQQQVEDAILTQWRIVGYDEY